MKIISAVTHFNVSVDVKVNNISCKVNCMCFVSSNDYTDVDVDPDEIYDIIYNGFPISNVEAFFAYFKLRGIDVATILREEASNKIDFEASQLLISKSHVINE